jgi:hypothetical protein
MTLLVRGALHAAALGTMTWGYLELSNTPQNEWISSQTVRFMNCVGAALIVITVVGRTLAIFDYPRVRLIWPPIVSMLIPD